MASKALTCSASALVSNRMSSNPSSVGFGPRSVPIRSSPTSIPPSRLSMEGRVQPQGRDIGNVGPFIGEDWHERVTLLDTSPNARTLNWNTSEDETEIKMWFDMPRFMAEDIKVNIVDNMLVIRGEGSAIDAFGKRIRNPYDTKLQLPANCVKEDIRAMFDNGVLYITVPKIAKFEHRVIDVPIRYRYV